MRSSSSDKEKAITVDMPLFALVVGLWWLLSLIVARAMSGVSFMAPVLEGMQQAVPAVRKSAHHSGFAAATTVFYCYFLITAPVVAPYYFKFVKVVKDAGRSAFAILWLIIPACIFALSIGMDLGPTTTRGFQRTFNMVLTSCWFGSSFIFLLYWHVLLSAITCIAKDLSAGETSAA